MYFGEYCEAYQKDYNFKQPINGEWKLGDEWYPCTILEDKTELGDDYYVIVTRNQTIMSERKDKVRFIGGNQHEKSN